MTIAGGTLLSDIDPAYAVPSQDNPITSDRNELMAIFKAPDFRSHPDLATAASLPGGNHLIPDFKLCYKISSMTYTDPVVTTDPLMPGKCVYM